MESPKQQWHTPLSSLELPENEVHVWRSSLHATKAAIHSLERILTWDELTRARRFHFERDRTQYIVAHGVLRVLLAGYLNVDPDRIRYCYNPYGKPALDLPWQENSLSFNMSHSHGLALYAFTRNRQLGIDVEYMRSDIDYDQLAGHNFSPKEAFVLCTLPLEAKQQAFFNCWTRKEAYIKARGKGLSIPLDLFDVSLLIGETAALLSSREDPQETSRWSLQELAPGPGYAGALAVEGSGWHLRCWCWSEGRFS